MLLDLREMSLLLWLSLPCTTSTITIPSNNAQVSARQSSVLEQAKTTASIPVQQIESLWVANVSIGGQEVLLCVDTGSSPL